MVVMHPRNIYNKRLNFNALASEFPEFKKHTTLDLKGQVIMDFKNIEALRILSKILLKKDFNLDVHFPHNGLVPTIPLRLNYILFIEDLLKLTNQNKFVKGLDIGVGASCIYPLIGAKKNGWQMVGTDINAESLNCAQNNIKNNNLAHLIEVVKVKEETILEEVLKQDSVRYDFCMCNPPFFGNPNELCSQLKRKANRSPPKNAFSAEMHEVITRGGEFTFVSKIIDESSEFQDRVRIYTSMLGIKRNVKLLLQKLHNIPAIKSAISTEFHQGNTTRFGIAWTFDDSIQLQQLPFSSDKKEKSTKSYVYNIKSFAGKTEEVGKQFTNIFNDLQLKHTPVKTDNENVVLYDLTAYSDTWSHSRRKRRELAHNSKCASKMFTKDAMVNNKDCSPVDEEKSAKRKCDYVMETVKRVKTEENIFLTCTLIIHISSELRIELAYINGSGGKNACHQILQYFKNHLKF